MRPSPAPGAPRQSQTVQMQFDDNTLLPMLFGEHDAHLDRIERQLGVAVEIGRASCRGRV